MATARLYSSTYPAQPLHPLSLFSWRSVLDEAWALTLRLGGYIGALAVLAMTAVELTAAIPSTDASDAARPAGARPAGTWAAAVRPVPAFDLPTNDLIAKSVTYNITRHPEGGRKDTFRWSGQADGKPLGTLEIYRAGSESDAFYNPAATLADLTDIGDPSGMQPAGMIDSKFGPMALLSFRRDGGACLGFVRTFTEPRLQLAGWTCSANSPATQRSQTVCALDRLTMLSAGNDPKLAELFAHAELKRGKCAEVTSGATDWVTSSDGPQLRGLSNNN